MKSEVIKWWLVTSPVRFGLWIVFTYWWAARHSQTLSPQELQVEPDYGNNWGEEVVLVHGSGWGS